jgi:type VI secretion system secreted protein Hcp
LSILRSRHRENFTGAMSETQQFFAGALIMAYDAFLQLKDIPGESTATGFEKSIALLSMQFSAHANVTVNSGRGGMTTSKVAVSEIIITKKTDVSSNKLFHACCLGTHIATGKVSFRKQTGHGQEAYLIYVFSDLVIASFSFSGTPGSNDAPHESASIAFSKVQIEYKTQNADGKLVSGTPVVWDLTTLSDK